MVIKKALSPLQGGRVESSASGAERRGSFYIQRPRHDGGQSGMEQSGMERRGSVSSSLRERSPGEAVLQRKRTTVSETNDLQRSVL